MSRNKIECTHFYILNHNNNFRSISTLITPKKIEAVKFVWLHIIKSFLSELSASLTTLYRWTKFKFIQLIHFHSNYAALYYVTFNHITSYWTILLYTTTVRMHVRTCARMYVKYVPTFPTSVDLSNQLKHWKGKNIKFVQNFIPTSTISTFHISFIYSFFFFIF